MKIGIVLTAYNVDDYISQCLRPWLELKKDYNLLISCNSGMFKDYHQLGFKEKNENTTSILVNSKLDFLVTTNGENSLDEDYSRNLCLSFLNRNNCDIIWVVDGDEIYSKNEIKNILDFIIKNPEHSSYSIEFKNYTFHYPYFTKGFRKPVIYRTNFNDGISHFTFDTYIQYNDGTHIDNILKCCPIPKSICFTNHFSWLESDTRTLEKIKYQNIRYFGEEHSRCAYMIKNHELKFNNKFFTDRGMEIPILYKESNIISHDFEIKYSRSESRIYIDWILRNMNIEVIISDGNNSNKSTSHFLSCNQGYIYFIDNDLLKEENLNIICVQVIENNKTIHVEELILNLE